jgi:hypothetical protein
LQASSVRWPFFLLIAIGCLNGCLGYLIRYRGFYNLLAGTSPIARARVAPWTGGWTIVVGLLCILWGVGGICWPERGVAIARLMSCLLLVVIVTMFGGAARRAR